MHLYDIIVVGAGPSGCMAAITLSKNGLKVLLINKNSGGYIEERLGIANSKTIKLLNEYMVDTIKIDVKSISLSYKMDSISFLLGNDELNVFNVNKLHSNLFNTCVKNNVDIKSNEYVIDVKMENYYVEVSTNNDVYRSKFIIGADGVNSVVGKKTGIIKEQDYCIGVEALYKIDSPGKKCVEIDLHDIPYGYCIALNYDNWLSLYAISFSTDKIDIKKYFKSYIKSIGLKDTEAYYIKGNLVAVNNGKRQNFVNKRAALIGNAARIGNPLTGAGLYYAINSSIICSNVILNEINSDKSLNQLSLYNKEMSSQVLKDVKELYKLSKWFYKNKNFAFKFIKHVPYVGKYCAGLLCGRINPADNRLLTSIISRKDYNLLKDIRIIK